MRNLLTGKLDTREYPDPKPNRLVEDPWPPEDYLTAMRRLLNDAGKPGNHTANYIAAAAVLAKAANAAHRATPILPAKTAPARTPRDGDTIR